MSLKQFTDGYIEAALTSTLDDEDERPLSRTASASDLAPETRRQMEMDCGRFYDDNDDLWDLLSDEKAGKLFWLSRNGHGTGFWDEDDLTPDVRKKLQAEAKKYGSFDLYRDPSGGAQVHGFPLSSAARSTVEANKRTSKRRASKRRGSKRRTSKRRR